MVFHEPSQTEVALTGLIMTIIQRPFYKKYVDSIGLKGDERVLEFGPGSGKMSKYIVEALPLGHLTIVDLSPTWLEVVGKRLRKYNNFDLMQGKIMDLNIPDGSFDVVIASFVIHDVDDYERQMVVDLLASKIKKGGRMYVRDPEVSGRSGHGISREDLHRIMHSSGLKEMSFERVRPLYMGPMNRGIYAKE